MKQAIQVVFHGMEASEAVEAAARKKAEHLDQFAGDIMSCRVVVELSQKHKQQGRPYAVRIELGLAGRALVVGHVHDEDVYVALRDAFDAMKRQLEDVVRQRRGDEKLHPRELHGEITRLSTDEGIGFIRTPDGQDYYFDRGNLASGRFEQLHLGQPVRFIGEMAGEGLQAKRVSVGKHLVGLEVP